MLKIYDETGLQTCLVLKIHDETGLQTCLVLKVHDETGLQTCLVFNVGKGVVTVQFVKINCTEYNCVEAVNAGTSREGF